MVLKSRMFPKIMVILQDMASHHPKNQPSHFKSSALMMGVSPFLAFTHPFSEPYFPYLFHKRMGILKK